MDTKKNALSEAAEAVATMSTDSTKAASSTSTMVSTQTAGGIAGATLGGMIGGPVGAIIGGMAGAALSVARSGQESDVVATPRTRKSTNAKPVSRRSASKSKSVSKGDSVAGSNGTKAKTNPKSRKSTTRTSRS